MPIAETLDTYLSIESWNAEYLERWIGVTRDEGLRGGLRTILRREQAHSAELEARIGELGGKRRAAIPAAQRDQSFAFYGSPDVPDVDKLAALVEIFREPDQLLGFVIDVVKGDHPDEETRELLRTILDDEMATIEWVRNAHAARSH
jgi:hypothetical protein